MSEPGAFDLVKLALQDGYALTVCRCERREGRVRGGEGRVRGGRGRKGGRERREGKEGREGGRGGEVKRIYIVSRGGRV